MRIEKTVVDGAGAASPERGKASTGDASSPPPAQDPLPVLKPRPPTPPGQDLLAETTRLVAQLEAGEERGVFRSLCALARQARVDPEDYRRVLLRAGLRASRASEIKAVLLCPAICEEFTRDQLSWKESLAAAREQRNDPMTRTAALLVRLLFRHGPSCVGPAPGHTWCLEIDDHGQYRLLLPAGTLEMTKLSFAPSPAA